MFEVTDLFQTKSAQWKSFWSFCSETSWLKSGHKEACEAVTILTGLVGKLLQQLSLLPSAIFRKQQLFCTLTLKIIGETLSINLDYV